MPPRFDDSETSADVDVVEGEAAELTCKAGGNPVPDITWSREDKKQIHGNKDTPALRVGKKSEARTNTEPKLHLMELGISVIILIRGMNV